MKLCARFEVSFSFRDMFEELPESPGCASFQKNYLALLGELRS